MTSLQDHNEYSGAPFVVAMINQIQSWVDLEGDLHRHFTTSSIGLILVDWLSGKKVFQLSYVHAFHAYYTFVTKIGCEKVRKELLAEGKTPSEIEYKLKRFRCFVSLAVFQLARKIMIWIEDHAQMDRDIRDADPTGAYSALQLAIVRHTIASATTTQMQQLHVAIQRTDNESKPSDRKLYYAWEINQDPRKNFGVIKNLPELWDKARRISIRSHIYNASDLAIEIQQLLSSDKCSAFELVARGPKFIQRRWCTNNPTIRDELDALHEDILRPGLDPNVRENHKARRAQLEEAYFQASSEPTESKSEEGSPRASSTTTIVSTQGRQPTRKRTIQDIVDEAAQYGEKESECERPYNSGSRNSIATSGRSEFSSTYTSGSNRGYLQYSTSASHNSGDRNNTGSNRGYLQYSTSAPHNSSDRNNTATSRSDFSSTYTSGSNRGYLQYSTSAPHNSGGSNSGRSESGSSYIGDRNSGSNYSNRDNVIGSGGNNKR